MTNEEDKKQLAKPIVVCAANRSEIDGFLVLGARHYDKRMREAIDACGRKRTEFTEQGFIDQFGNFLTREEAFIIAEENKQIKRLCGTEHSKVLYSENLY